MTDPRYDRLGELAVGYSLELREGQVVRVDGFAEGAPLIAAVVRAALRRGAHAYTNVELGGLRELLLAEALDEQLTYISPVQRQEVEILDALVTIWGEPNTRSLTHADPERQGRWLGAKRELRKRFWERVVEGKAGWVGTQAPTHAHAQDAEMSLSEYEDFLFRACHVLEDEDPFAYWRARSESLADRAGELRGSREIRVVGPDTDLTLSVEGRTWLPADGRWNLPDGEVFTSPVEDGVDGEIRLGFPVIFQGREMEDVRLRFEAGRVVAAEAARGEDYLHALLDMDDQSRHLGELAFGLNYEIDRFTRNMLFDEKIGGTIHVALGAGFPQAGGTNTSGLHLDMICDLREEGEIFADGELAWKAGRFLRAAEKPNEEAESAEEADPRFGRAFAGKAKGRG